MKIYLATDHAGFELKEKIKEFLVDAGHEVEDFGARSYDPQDDYPDYILKAAEAIAKYPEGRAIILGGSGQGEAMVANRHKGVRAVVYYGGDKRVLELSREHNDANTLALGARFLNDPEAFEAVKLWLETPFSGDERHVRRIGKF
jgi:ribose 5-phosphate isomerase B